MRSGCRAWGAALALLASLVFCPGVAGDSGETGEVRALWVLRGSLSSPAAIAAMVRTAAASGFNTLLVQVRGRGDAYYASDLEPRAAPLSRQPASFDPLADTLQAAHASGLRVHAWINVGLVASATVLPSARDHLMYRHPEWLMVPRSLAGELASFDPANPGYAGKLARWTRARPDEFEGLYLSPIPRGAADHVVSVVSDVARRYAVDGVHLDYIRYPGRDFDYSRAATAEFRAELLPGLAGSDRDRLDREARADALAYPDAAPERWATFRRARLTALVVRIRNAMAVARPGALLSAAVLPDADEAAADRFQDWRTWIDTGLIDVVCPMAYAAEGDAFGAQVAAARATAGGRLWVGIGAWRLPVERTLEHIASARRLGVRGVALFSYDSLMDDAQPGYLGRIGRSAFPRAADEPGSR